MSDRFKLRIALSLLVFAALPGCDRRSAQSPTAPSPGPAAAPPPSSFSGATENKVSGVVTDTALRPIDGAVVEVVTGSSHGLSVVADAEGRYSLSSGDFDDTTEFRARKAGYAVETKTRGTRCADCLHWTLSFVLGPAASAQ